MAGWGSLLGLLGPVANAIGGGDDWGDTARMIGAGAGTGADIYSTFQKGRMDEALWEWQRRMEQDRQAREGQRTAAVGWDPLSGAAKDAYLRTLQREYAARGVPPDSAAFKNMTAEGMARLALEGEAAKTARLNALNPALPSAASWTFPRIQMPSGGMGQFGQLEALTRIMRRMYGSQAGPSVGEMPWGWDEWRAGERTSIPDFSSSPSFYPGGGYGSLGGDWGEPTS